MTTAFADPGVPALGDRRDAARRLLVANPEHSDRGIAARCGLSPKTVARVREELVAQGRVARTDRPVARIGRDGRVRPVDAQAVRARIAEELERQPHASLRTIARAVGASPETVRSVRNALRSGATTTPDLRELNRPLAPVIDLPPRPREEPFALGNDRACTDRDGGREFVEWFDCTAVTADDVSEHLGTVPLSRVYEVADEARRRAERWLRFAEAVEGRARRQA
jgi:AraC-like DNA-binding protein